MYDFLEREADLRDQLKFAEEDLSRTQLRLQVHHYYLDFF